MAAKKKRRCKVCKKYFLPQHDTTTCTQLVCSLKCCLKGYSAFTGRKTKALAKSWAIQVGRRSMGEVKFEHIYLEGKNVVSHDYEADCLKYRVEETKKYTPDWTVVVSKGHTMYIEYKGVLDQATRKKMLLVKTQHPNLDIRIVFQRGKNKIYKGSKTTYMEWAAKHGFIAADNEVPESWFKKDFPF